MARVKTNVARRRRVGRILKKAEGYWGDRSKRLIHARDTLRRAMVFATRDRKVMKRDFRRLWMVRINAACRAHDLSYSRFMQGLKKKQVILNRKILAELAATKPEVLGRLFEFVKKT